MSTNRRARLASLGTRSRQTSSAPATGKKQPALVRGKDLSLVEALMSLDARQDQDRSMEENHHASALVSGCPRAQALKRLGLVHGTRSISSADRLLWAIGRAVEHHIRTTLIEYMGMDNVYGQWSCLCEKEKSVGFGDPEAYCRKCDSKVSRYGELEMADEELSIAGHPDFIYRLKSNGRFRVVEIKSKKKELFEVLQAAEPVHIYQGGMYQKLGNGMGLPMDETVTVLYGAKDYPRPGVKVYKEFSYPMHLPEIEQAMRIAWENAVVINRATIKNPPPRLGGCASTSSPMAKQCAACSACFSLPK